ncbi:hypothetical protein [Brevibacillus reuszeri]|uniref:hypothetical protein n=1 Tax=Brevibacillus reuszeri TaxID=54915 RepID=UPI000CCBFFEE|nr:hypothetical protein [Brevibacillus reuszeri]
MNKASYYVDNVALGTWDAASTLTMSEDGRTVTIKLSGKTLVNATDYAIVIDGINDFKNENPVPKYTKVITFNDTVRPTVSGVTYDDSITARVGFSEALSSAGTVVVLDSTGKDVTANFGTPGTATLSSDKKSFTVDLKDAKVLNNVNYTVKIVGAKDLAGNLVNPNPVTVTVKKNITETDAPVATSVEALGYDKVKVTFNEKLSDPGKIAVGAGTAVAISTASTGNATVDSTGLVYTVTLAGDNVQTADGVYTVTLTDFVDLNGNKTASATKAVSFKGDTTAPVFGSSRVEQIGSTQYLVVTYDDTNVQPQTAAGAITGTYIDADGIEKAANIVTTGNAIYDPNLTGKSNAIQIALPATVADYGTYTVTLPKGLVKDTAGNQSAAKQVTFTLGQGSDTAKPKLTEANLTVQGALGADTVKAVFSKPLDKTTAQDVNNYLVDGVAVFSKAVFDTDTKTVKLTLKPGAIDLTGDRLVTVKNVKDVSGNVMETVNFSKGFTENVKPTLVSAALTTPKTITLTFSEDLKLSTIEGVKADADKDLVIYSGTDALTLATTATIAKDGDDKHFVVTLAADVTADQLAKALTVEVLSSNDIVDVATPANGLAATTVNVAK